VSAIAGALFLIVHAIYVGYWAKPAAESQDDSKLAAAAARVPERVVRHTFGARAFHWVMSASMLVLVFTAFLPKVGVKFSWVKIHWMAGIVLIISVVYHAIHATFWLDFWSIWPDKQDIEDASRRFQRALGKAAPPPKKFGKYPLENKLFHLSALCAGSAVICTGFFMLFRVRTPFLPRDPYLFGYLTWGVIYVLHGLAGVAIVALILMHIYIAVRPEKFFLTKSMIFGWISREKYLGHYSPERWPVEEGVREGGQSKATRRRVLGFVVFAASASIIWRVIQLLDAASDVIATSAKALNVFDFEKAAHRNVMPGHWAYIVGGVDDDATVSANREGFKHVQLLPRRLRDATKVDMHVDLFGATFDSPIFLCPTSGQKAFHPDGEMAVARAARARGTMQFLSTSASTSVEDVNKALGRPTWFQLYAPSSWEVCEKILRRVEVAGCPVIALTVDNQVGRNNESYVRLRWKDPQECAHCHEVEPGTNLKERPIYDGINMTGVKRQFPSMDWAFVDRLRKSWKGKLILKGIDTREDARLCVEHGIDGVLVSNHGGRATETLRPTIESLPEVVAAVGGRIPVFVDGGFRRGTDVFKALALGATAVGIGRPYLWGMGAFGQAGVDRVLEILQGELKLVMGNCGTRTVADINHAYVATPDWKI
jgi:isopentenyl diphosphate isomerase/L-lactate dehydrogenase-like FMN-dependent dehydrogenase/cytochrome b subunit of formate dehydrogenase